MRLRVSMRVIMPSREERVAVVPGRDASSEAIAADASLAAVFREVRSVSRSRSTLRWATLWFLRPSSRGVLRNDWSCNCLVRSGLCSMLQDVGGLTRSR